jgi:hypothetical protein
VAFLALLFLLLSATLVPSGSASRDAVAPAAQSGRAGLTIVRTKPVTVVGRAFEAGERVRVTLDGRRKTVTASARGSFTVVFPEANACNGFVVVARGSEGSRASVAFAQFSNVHCLERESATASSARKPALRVMTREQTGS